jgi:hypothetical protein
VLLLGKTIISLYLTWSQVALLAQITATELWAEAKLFKLKDTVKTNVYLSFGSAIRRLTKGKSS